MHFKILGMIAAVALIAACETAPDESGTAGGAGAEAGAVAGTGAGAGAGAGTTPMADVSRSAAVAGPLAGSQNDLVVNVGDRVFFDFDKYNLKPEARGVLEAQAAWLKSFPAVTVTVEGHCDERGTREYNLALGERRANAVKDYLTALGVAPGRIRTISYGKERPVALGSNEAAWAQNRRGVTVVTGGSPGS